MYGAFQHRPYQGQHTQAEAWVYDGAYADLDFANERYHGLNQQWHGSGNLQQQHGGGCGAWIDAGNKSNLFYTKDTDGIWRPATTNTAANDVSLPRINRYGLWIEGKGNDKNFALQSRDLTITLQVAVSGGSGNFTNGETVTATGGGTGVYVSGQSTAAIFAIRNGTGTFTGTLTGGSSAATRTLGTVTTVWTISGAADLSVTKTSIVGADAISGNGNRITCNVNGGTITQALTGLTSGVYSGSFVIRRISGSGNVDITVDGGTSWTTLSLTAAYAQYGKATGTVTASTFGLRMATAGDVIEVDFGQNENNLAATSPIVTATVFIQRGTSSNGGLYLNHVTTTKGNHGYRIITDVYHDTPMTCLIQYSGNFDTSAIHLLFGDDINNCIVQSSAAGASTIKVAAGDTNGAGSSNFTGSDADVSGLYTLNKVMIGLDGFGCKICVNGGAISSSATPKNSKSSDGTNFTGSFAWGAATNGGTTHGQILNNGAESTPVDGYCKRITWWKSMRPERDFKELTKVFEPY